MTWAYLAASFLFLTGSIRGLTAAEPIIEWVMFLSLVVSAILSWKVRAVWIAYFSYILLIYYNPHFLIMKNFPNSYIADICIGLVFFILSLRWQKYKEPIT